MSVDEFHALRAEPPRTSTVLVVHDEPARRSAPPSRWAGSAIRTSSGSTRRRRGPAPRPGRRCRMAPRRGSSRARRAAAREVARPRGRSGAIGVPRSTAGTRTPGITTRARSKPAALAGRHGTAIRTSSSSNVVTSRDGRGLRRRDGLPLPAPATVAVDRGSGRARRRARLRPSSRRRPSTGNQAGAVPPQAGRTARRVPGSSRSNATRSARARSPRHGAPARAPSAPEPSGRAVVGTNGRPDLPHHARDQCRRCFTTTTVHGACATTCDATLPRHELREPGASVRGHDEHVGAFGAGDVHEHFPRVPCITRAGRETGVTVLLPRAS